MSRLGEPDANDRLLDVAFGLFVGTVAVEFGSVVLHSVWLPVQVHLALLFAALVGLLRGQSWVMLVVVGLWLLIGSGNPFAPLLIVSGLAAIDLLQRGSWARRWVMGISIFWLAFGVLLLMGTTVSLGVFAWPAGGSVGLFVRPVVGLVLLVILGPRAEAFSSTAPPARFAVGAASLAAVAAAPLATLGATLLDTAEPRALAAGGGPARSRPIRDRSPGPARPRPVRAELPGPPLPPPLAAPETLHLEDRRPGGGVREVRLVHGVAQSGALELGSQASEGAVRFEWSAVPGAVRYEAFVTRRERGSSITVTRRYAGASNHWTVDVSPGFEVSQFRVRAFR